MKTRTKYVFGMLTAAILVLTFSGCIANERTPFEQYLENPCNGEAVIISGDYLFNPTDNNGGHLTVQGTGVGNLGNEYVVNGEVNVISGMDTEMDVANLNIITKGNAPNFKVRARYHTVDGNVIIDYQEEICSGKLIPTPTPLPP